MFEFMDCGSLYEMVKRGCCRDEKVLFCITRQCLLGIEELHEQNKIHHDIKPVNILLNSCGEVKIADFGFSRSLSKYLDDDTINTNHASTFVGTTQYMNP
jgi:serine/threonine protein kinase